MTIERTNAAVAASVATSPAVRPTTTVGRLRLDETTGSSAASGGAVLFDEAIDIQFGFDRQTGHLLIAGGDVRIEARSSSQPAPGSLGAPEPGRTGLRSTGSLVNFVA